MPGKGNSRNRVRNHRLGRAFPRQTVWETTKRPISVKKYFSQQTGNYYDAGHDTDTILLLESSLHHTSDTYLVHSYQQSHTTDSAAYDQTSVYHSSDTLLMSDFSGEFHLTDTFLQADAVSTWHNTDSYLYGPPIIVAVDGFEMAAGDLSSTPNLSFEQTIVRNSNFSLLVDIFNRSSCFYTIKYIDSKGQNAQAGQFGTLFHRFDFRINGFPSSYDEIWCERENPYQSGSYGLRLGITNTGNLVLFNISEAGIPSQIVATSSIQLQTNTWYLIEIERPPQGFDRTVKVYVDGNLVISHTYSYLPVPRTVRVGRTRAENIISYYCYYDNYITSKIRLPLSCFVKGDTAISYLEGSGFSDQPPGSGYAQVISDRPPDGDMSYVWSSSVGSYVKYLFSTNISQYFDSEVYAFKTYALARHVNADSARITINSNIILQSSQFGDTTISLVIPPNNYEYSSHIISADDLSPLGKPNSSIIDIDVRIDLVYLTGYAGPAARLTQIGTETVIGAVVRSVSHSTDSILDGNINLKHFTSSSLYGEKSITHTADSFPAIVDDKEHSSDSLIVLSFAKDHLADAGIFGSVSTAHSTDIDCAFIVDHYTDSYIKYLGEDHTTDTSAYGTVSISHSCDSFIVYTFDNDHTTDIEAWIGQDMTTDVLAVITNDEMHMTSSVLIGTVDRWMWTDSQVLGTIDVQFSADSYLVVTYETGFSTDLYLYSLINNGHFTSSSLFGYSEKQFHISSTLLGSLTTSFTIDSYIQEIAKVESKLDSLLVGYFDRGHTTESLFYIPTVVSISHDTSSSFYLVSDSSHSTDAPFIKSLTISSTTSTNTSGTISANFWTDVLTKPTNLINLTFRSDSRLSKVIDVINKIDSRFFARYTVNHLSDLSISGTSSLIHYSNNLRYAEYAVSFSSSSWLVVSPIISNSTSSMLYGSYLLAFSSDIRTAYDPIFSTNSSLVGRVDKNHNFDTTLRATYLLSYSADSYAVFSYAISHSSSSVSALQVSRTHLTFLFSVADLPVSHLCNIFASKETNAIFFTDSRAVRFYDKFHNSSSSILGPVSIQYSCDSYSCILVDNAYYSDSLLIAQIDLIFFTLSLLSKQFDSSFTTSSYLAFERIMYTNTNLFGTINLDHTTSISIRGSIDIGLFDEEVFPLFTIRGAT